MNKIFVPILFGFASVAAVSCGTVKQYQEISTVDDKLFANYSEEGKSVAEYSWEEFFTDSKLQDLVRQALENNIDLKTACEHVLQAEASISAAKLSFVPNLSVGAASSIAETNFVVTAPFDWQLSIFRKITNLKSSKASYEQMLDYRQAVQSALISNMASLYYNLLMLDAQYAVASELEANWIKSVDVVKALKEAGMADQVAVSQYQATLDNITVTRIGLEESIVIVENAINGVLNNTPGTPVSRSKLIDQTCAENLSLGVPAALLTRRPDVRAAQRDVEMAYYAERNALLNFFPTLSLNGSLGLQGLASLSASIVEPILNSGANKANYKRAQSRQREARLAFDKTILAAGTEICDAVATFKSCSEKENYLNSQVENLDKARQDTDYLMMNSYDKTYLDVLYANNSYFDAIIQYIANKAQKLQTAAKLYSALGGGTDY